MKTLHLYALLFLFQSTFASYAFVGCGYLPSDFTVIGNYTYDSATLTYNCREGDTLLVTYNGTGGGQSYMEDYYFDGVFWGSRLDTFKVYRSGVLQLQQGCGNADYICNRNFTFSLTNSVAELSSTEISMVTYSTGQTKSMNLVIHSSSLTSYDVDLYSLSGQKISELQNATPNTILSLTCVSNSINILRLTDREGRVFSKKVFAF
jgi:hypothetical protein